MWSSAYARVLFMAGREEARERLEPKARRCAGVLQNTPAWAQSHLYLGQLDEAAGRTPEACGHYGQVLSRWGHAKPRSVTADEARFRAGKLRCAL
jgi:serine/threonine-protein kinase